ncbi:MAG: hypothetical protein JNM00_01320 [Flavobacteriales bacterium]|nr:hypothetical protein [Flavobacteriales bacterium]
MINLKLINAIARMAIVVCCCWLSNTSLWAQFEGAYYSNLSKNHQSVVESVFTPGNTVVAETIGGNTATTLDIHLLELDGAGNVVNERTYDSGANEEAFHIAPSIAGGYVVCGYQSNAGRDRGLILEFDANFNLVNQARYHNTSTKHSTAFHIIPTVADPVPGYVVVGTLASDFTYTGAKTSYVLKLDGALNKLWERHLNSAAPAGPQDWDMAVHVLEIPGQGYFVGGSATATPGNNSTFCDQTVMAARISYANVVVWKKSMDDNGPSTSGHLSIGADAFYDASTNEIYQLANFSINHHFGIVVYDFATGAINPAKSFKVFSNLGYINLDGMRILPDPSGNTYVVAGYLRDGNYTAPDGTFVSGTFPFACEIDKVSQTTIWDELYPVPAAGFAGTSTAPYDLFFAGQQPLNLHPKMALRYNSGNGYSLTGPRTAPIVPFETELLQLDLMGLNPCLSTPIALNPIVLQPTDYALGFTSAVLTRQNPALTLVPVGTTPDLCSTNDPCTVDASFSINPLGDCCYEFQDLTPDASAVGANCDYWEIFDAFGAIVATGTGDSFVFCFPSSGSFLICNNDCCINGDGSLTTSKICQPLEVQCCNIQPAIVSSNEGCIYSFYVINTTSTPLDQICYTWLDGTTHTGNDTITVDLSGYCGIYGGCVPIYCCNDPSNVTTFCFDQYVCCQPCEPDPNFNVLYLDPCCISVEPNNPTPCLLSPLGVATTDVNGDGVIDAADTAIILNSGCCSVDWGDGTTSLPGVHCYTISGVYTVCYTACCIGTDGVLYSATSCQQVTVQCGQPCDPNPLFEYTVDACCVSIFPVATAPCIISPLGTATIDINNDGVIDNTDLQILLAANCCTVDWGDGTLTNGVFNHCYATGGVYTICYTACCVGTDGQLYSATHCETITINCCAPVDFTWAIL